VKLCEHARVVCFWTQCWFLFHIFSKTDHNVYKCPYWMSNQKDSCLWQLIPWKIAVQSVHISVSLHVPCSPPKCSDQSWSWIKYALNYKCYFLKTLCIYNTHKLQIIFSLDCPFVIVPILYRLFRRLKQRLDNITLLFCIR
jgi:hypothetical protein